MDPGNFYDILGLHQAASQKDIEKAYKKQALKFHPDRHPAAEKASATAKFQKLAEAYDTLKDDKLRNRYDETLLGPRAGAGSETAVARPNSYQRPGAPPPEPSTAPPSSHGTPQRPPNPSRPSQAPPHTFRPPPVRPPPRRDVDPYKIFEQAWGKTLQEIEREIDRRVWDPDFARHSPRKPTDHHGRDRSYTGMEGYRPDRRQASSPQVGETSRSWDPDPFRNADRNRAEHSRRRAHSVMGMRPSDYGGQGQGQQQPQTVKEIHQTIITVEKSASGVHLKREIKSRKHTDDGLVHDRYRRTRAGIEYGYDADPNYAPDPTYAPDRAGSATPMLSQPRPPHGYPSRREAQSAEAPYHRPGSAFPDPGRRGDGGHRPGYSRSPTSGSDLSRSASSGGHPPAPWLPSGPMRSRSSVPPPPHGLSRSGSHQLPPMSHSSPPRTRSRTLSMSGGGPPGMQIQRPMSFMPGY